MSRDIDFSASRSGFSHKSEKISSETITTNRVFRPENRYPHHDFGINRGKDEKGNFEMSESPSHPQTTILELTKLIGLMSSTVQAVLPSRLS